MRDIDGGVPREVWPCTKPSGPSVAVVPRQQLSHLAAQSVAGARDLGGLPDWLCSRAKKVALC